MAVFKGEFNGKNAKIAIVISRFNDFISSKLLDGALDYLMRHQVYNNQIDIFWVPGAFEIPLAAKKVAKTKKYDGIICLGAVIRGETPHFNFVAAEATKGIAQVMLSEEIPVAYGLLTTDDTDQAIERAGTKAGNKGWQAAESVLEMISLLKQIR